MKDSAPGTFFSWTIKKIHISPDSLALWNLLYKWSYREYTDQDNEQGNRTSNTLHPYPICRRVWTYFLIFIPGSQKEMAKIWHGLKSRNFRKSCPWRDTTTPRSLASNPTIQRPRLPGTEQEENIDQNQLCENCAPTNTPGNGPQSLLRALFLGTVPKLGFATTVTHCKLRRAKPREQRGPLREGRRLEREHRQTETALLWKTDPGTQRHSCLQRLN